MRNRILLVLAVTCALTFGQARAETTIKTGSNEMASKKVIENIYPELENGLYLIQAELNKIPTNIALPEGYKLVKFSYDHLSTREDEEYREPRNLIIKAKPNVKLILNESPEITPAPGKHKFSLQLSLAKNAAKELEEFTGKNVNRGVALVAGGKILTTHTIRCAITGGKLRITRCNDDGCQFIFINLKK